MFYLISKILLGAFALLVSAQLIDGIVLDGLYIALIAAIVLGILNTLVKPVLVILTLPINIVSLGLFTFIINAFLFWFAASFLEGFVVDGFIPALLGSLIVSVIHTIGSQFLSSS
ncbi:hypothetical protein CL653_01345 [bacterium]|nr:hypothetical protein [bacterium]